MRLHNRRGCLGVQAELFLETTWPFRQASRPPRASSQGTEKTWTKGQDLIGGKLFTALSRTFLSGTGFLPCTCTVLKEPRLPLGAAAFAPSRSPVVSPAVGETADVSKDDLTSSAFSVAHSKLPG